MKDSYNCIFHYNEYTTNWYCVHRNEYREYWNENKLSRVGVGESAEDAYKNYKTKQLSYK